MTIFIFCVSVRRTNVEKQDEVQLQVDDGITGAHVDVPGGDSVECAGLGVVGAKS